MIRLRFRSNNDRDNDEVIRSSPRAILRTRITLMMVGLMGMISLFISSSTMPTTDRITINTSSWFHLLRPQRKADIKKPLPLPCQADICYKGQKEKKRVNAPTDGYVYKLCMAGKQNWIWMGIQNLWLCNGVLGYCCLS